MMFINGHRCGFDIYANTLRSVLAIMFDIDN